jgi:thiamine kinase-like enzyme
MQLVEPVLQKQHCLCFMHLDLHSLNILVCDGQLVAIVDWECAGWYLEYWEHTTICYKVHLHKPESIFWDAVRAFSGQYQEELMMEMALWKCMGDIAIPPGDCPELGDPPLGESAEVGQSF